MRDYKVIGVDPSFRKGGFVCAVLDIDNNIEIVQFKKFIDFMSFVTVHVSSKDRVCIENSYLQNVSFDLKGNKEVIARKARNVGINQACSQIATDLFKLYSENVREVSPKEKGLKIVNDAIIFGFLRARNIKTDKNKFNQDARDAIKLLLMIL